MYQYLSPVELKAIASITRCMAVSVLDSYEWAAECESRDGTTQYGKDGHTLTLPSLADFAAKDRIKLINLVVRFAKLEDMSSFESIGLFTGMLPWCRIESNQRYYDVAAKGVKR